MKTTRERVIYLIDLSKGTKYAIALALGISHSVVSRLMAPDGKNPGPKVIRNVAELFKVDQKWLKTGEGPTPTLEDISHVLNFDEKGEVESFKLERPRGRKEQVKKDKTKDSTLRVAELPLNAEIHGRFFHALDTLIERGDLKSILKFTELANISSAYFYKFKQQPKNSIVPASYLALLVKNYRISAFWLLTGEGEMM